MPRKKPSGWVMSSSCGTLRPRSQIEDRAGDGREARAVAARPALEPVFQPLQVLDPFVGVGDRIGDQVVDRRTAGTRRELSGDLTGLLGAARGAAGDLEDAGAEFAEHAGERPALVVVAHSGGVAAILRCGREAERPGMHRLAHQLLHLRELFGGRLDPLARGVAHHIAADARMADQGADIDAALFAERIQIVADQFPGHVDPGLQDR